MSSFRPGSKGGGGRRSGNQRSGHHHHHGPAATHHAAAAAGGGSGHPYNKKGSSNPSSGSAASSIKKAMGLDSLSSSSSSSAAAMSSQDPSPPLTSTKYSFFNYEIEIRDMGLRQKVLVVETAFLLLNVIQLCIQSFSLYHRQIGKYDFDLLLLAILTLARHLPLRWAGGENGLSGRKWRRYFSSLPNLLRPRFLSCLGLAVILLFSSFHLLLTNSLAFVLVAFPWLLSAWPMGQFPAPLPPDLRSGETHPLSTSSNSNNGGSGGNGGAASNNNTSSRSYQRRRVALAMMIYILYRLADSLYLSGLLPILANRHYYLYYNMMQCLNHVLIFFVQNCILLIVLLTMVLGKQVYMEGQLRKAWQALPSAPAASSNTVPRWRNGETYKEGAVVIHRGYYYTARMVDRGGVDSRRVNKGIEPFDDGDGLTVEKLVCDVFAYEGAASSIHGTSSPVLLGMQCMQVMVILSLYYVMMTSRRWGPYFFMLISSMGSVLVTHVVQQGGGVEREEQEEAIDR